MGFWESVRRLAVGLGLLFAVAFIVAYYTKPAHGQGSSGKNIPVSLMPSATRSTTPITTADLTNDAFTRIHVIINVSTYTSGNYTPKIQGKDPVSGQYYDILVGPAISATGVTVLKVGPGLVPLLNGTAQDVLPRTWRLRFDGVSTPSMVFSVGAFLFGE